MGASKQVTGSCHLVEVYIEGNRYNIVVDFGMVQNNLMKMNDLYRMNKNPKSIDWEDVDVIILTHSHADHSALLPVAIMSGFKGDIVTTEPTIRLTELILTDSAFIQDRECSRYNKSKKGRKSPIYPIYSQRHVEETMSRFRGYGYDQKIKLNEYISVTLKSAGHLLGACSPYIEIKNGENTKRILFTGDTSASKNLPFVKKPDMNGLKVDYLFTESTYGDKVQKRNDVKRKLKKYIKWTVNEKKGKLVIPVFSVGRSSAVIKYLYDIFNESDDFNNVDIYLASPMACKAHRIYGDKYSHEFYDEYYPDVFNWSKINYIDDYKVLEKEVLNKKPMIVLVSSGMVQGGYANAVASGMLPHDNSTVLFCGYQGMGSTGRAILESEYGDTINIDSKYVKRRCAVDFMSMSSHADYLKIIDMISNMRHTKIKKIFLNHGDIEPLIFFKRELEAEFNSEVNISDFNKWYKLC